MVAKSSDTDPYDAAGPLILVITIANKLGLHARASAKFVKCVGQFDARVTVSCDGMKVPGKSIMGLMMLGAGPGTEIEIASEGRQAQEVLNALTHLIEAKFDED